MNPEYVREISDLEYEMENYVIMRQGARPRMEL